MFSGYGGGGYTSLLFLSWITKYYLRKQTGISERQADVVRDWYYRGIYAGDRRHNRIRSTSIAATIPKRLRHRDTPVDISRLCVPTVYRERRNEKKNTFIFIYIWNLAKVSATAAMFAIRLGGAFWNPWKKRAAGAAVSMTLGSRHCIEYALYEPARAASWRDDDGLARGAWTSDKWLYGLLYRVSICVHPKVHCHADYNNNRYNNHIIYM